MSIPTSRAQFKTNQLYASPEQSAIDVLVQETGCTTEAALETLRALVRGGWVIAPREPSNAMLEAYMASYGQKPTQTSSTITALGKARRRWLAMASTGTAMALSRRFIK